MRPPSLSPWFACALSLVVATASACDKRRDGSRPEGATIAPESSAITIANVFGTCEDEKGCEDACDAGDADPCRKLGTTYQFGNASVTKDEARATAYYERACAMKNAMGCVSSGQMYEFHHGVTKDDAKAATYYEKGCELGYQVGCANWAIMLENGRGVPKDVTRARALYEEACRQGAGLACERRRALGAADGGGGP
jgi:TPR repeat protein